MTERKIVDYVTAVEDSLDALDNVIRSYLNDGWAPFGSLAFSDNTNNPALPVAWVQPMVRYAEPEPDNAALVAYRDRIVEDLQKLFTDGSWIYTKFVRAILDKITSGEIGGAL
jgi:hypothetical protein